MAFPFPWRLADLPKPAPDAPTVATTFSGGGGSSMGYKLAGFRVVAACDIDPFMRDNYLKNMEVPTFACMPVNELTAGPIPPECDRLDVLDGSPPCSVFSMSGNREDDWQVSRKFQEGQANQVLDDLFFHFVALAKKWRPRAVIAENVKGMLIGKARGYVKAVARVMDDAGYDSQLFLVNAADCGVPQRRERVFFVGVRKDLGAPKLALDPHEPWVTASRALDGLPTMTAAELDALAIHGVKSKFWWAQTRPGEAFSEGLKRAGRFENQWYNDVKLHPDKPAQTVLAGSNNYHWDEPRKFSARELARLQSFPDDYRFVQDNRAGYVVGMSVPPIMAATVASAVREQWLRR